MAVGSPDGGPRITTATANTKAGRDVAADFNPGGCGRRESLPGRALGQQARAVLMAASNRSDVFAVLVAGVYHDRNSGSPRSSPSMKKASSSGAFKQWAVEESNLQPWD
jgi:hypothetical protein